MPLINCEINLNLTWSKNCIWTSKATRDANPDADPEVAAISDPAGAKFQIKDTKLYVPVVTVSTGNGKTLLEQLKTGFRRTIKWNKYMSEMTSQTRNNNLNYLFDPKFTKFTFQEDLYLQNLSYLLKMKRIEHLFQSIMYQMSK